MMDDDAPMAIGCAIIALLLLAMPVGALFHIGWNWVHTEPASQDY